MYLHLRQMLKDDRTNDGGGDRTQQEDNGGLIFHVGILLR
jgi:hypothetical protein